MVQSSVPELARLHVPSGMQTQVEECLAATPRFEASAVQQLSSEGVAILFHATRSLVRAPAAYVLPCDKHVGYSTSSIWGWILSQALK